MEKKQLQGAFRCQVVEASIVSLQSDVFKARRQRASEREGEKAAAAVKEVATSTGYDPGSSLRLALTL